MPDGMTIDTDGNLWVAMWGGWSILCCNPYTGEIIDRINIPVSNVTSCTFGGRDMSTLYITTARAELSEKEKKEQELEDSNRILNERNRILSALSRNYTTVLLCDLKQDTFEVVKADTFFLYWINRKTYRRGRTTA